MFNSRYIASVLDRRAETACMRPQVQWFGWLLGLVVTCSGTLGVAQDRLYRLSLKNGMAFEGRFDSIDEIAKDLTVRNTTAGGVALRPIVIVDDDLRRTYFPKRNLISTIDAQQEVVVKVNRRRSNTRKRVGTVGTVLDSTAFDRFGRRTVSVMTNSGRQQISQEITEISPIYTRLQSPQYDWDMRIATSSIPSDQLRGILLASGENDAETWLDLVRLLFLSERYQEAARELDLVIKQFPDLDQEQLERQRQALVTQGAELLLREISRRRKAGQHRYATFLLRGFENAKVGTSEHLIEASDMLSEYAKKQQQAERILAEMAPLVESMDGDPPRQKLVEQLHEEIKSDLNVHNLPRLATFLNSARSDGLTDHEKVAIAISGWLLGQGQDIRNLEVASSLLEVRNLVREYLRAMGDQHRHTRQELLAKIADREGGSPEYVTQLLKHMKPPLDLPTAADIPGLFEVQVPGLPDEFPVEYVIQLPPEYDPYARYPAIVTLHAAGAGPRSQITWWAGEYDSGKDKRVGQATRYGYIVVAPKWTQQGQKTYQFSAREHHVVLAALRDALRRFSIDNDRVFLSGHALGGDAAWDIAVAHPDLWAGMVLVGARSSYGKQSPQYVTFYDRNAKAFPMYFVFGELDGNKIHGNAIPLNRYMRPGYDAVLVQYKGRGNEHFYEEIQRIFDWLELQQRGPMPTDFEVDTMRPWDNFFWFTEFDGFPPKTMVSPFDWSPAKSSEITASVANNRINIKTGASSTTVWLSPEMVDFDERIQVRVKGRQIRDDFIPDLETILEDARTRADRQHVFWAKVEVTGGR